MRNCSRLFELISHLSNDNEQTENWGSAVAKLVQTRFGNNVFNLIVKFGWQLDIEENDQLSLPVQRLAVWEGDSKTIRIFFSPLSQHFTDLDFALKLTCAHEIFHGLAANRYKPLNLPHDKLPRLTAHQEELAADAFARALLDEIPDANRNRSSSPRFTNHLFREA